MKRRILGFQRRVWWPKWTPASRSSRMLTTDTRSAPFGLVSIGTSPAGRAEPRSRRRHPRLGVIAGWKEQEREDCSRPGANFRLRDDDVRPWRVFARISSSLDPMQCTASAPAVNLEAVVVGTPLGDPRRGSPEGEALLKEDAEAPRLQSPSQRRRCRPAERSGARARKGDLGNRKESAVPPMCFCAPPGAGGFRGRRPTWSSCSISAPAPRCRISSSASFSTAPTRATKTWRCSSSGLEADAAED